MPRRKPANAADRRPRGRPGHGPRLVWLARRGGWYIRWSDRGRSKECATGERDAGRPPDELLGRFDPRTGGIAPAPPPGLRDIPVRTPDTLTVSEAVAFYTERRGRKLRAAATLAYAGERLLEWWGGRVVADVTEELVDAYRAAREAGAGRRRPVKPATVDRELVVLRAAIRAVWKAEKLTELPPFPRLRARAGREYALTDSEVERLLAAADAALPHLRLFTYLALFTAGRAGALLELGWNQVDTGDQPIVRLNPAGREQTAKGRATVPAPQRLAAVLRDARAAAERQGTLDLPLVHWRGHPIRSVRRGFRTLVTAAGLPVAGPRAVTPHVLRHTAASIMARRGVPLAQVAAWLGQSVTRTTEKYIHLTPGYLAQARAALDGESLRPVVVGGTLAVVTGGAKGGT